MRWLDQLTENTAAISAAVHRHDRFHVFYDSVKRDLSGFPGIWTFCAELGRCFTEAEFEGRHVAGETYEWLPAILEMADRAIDVCVNGDGPHSVSWFDEAATAISINSHPKEPEGRPRITIHIS